MESDVVPGFSNKLGNSDFKKINQLIESMVFARTLQVFANMSIDFFACLELGKNKKEQDLDIK